MTETVLTDQQLESAIEAALDMAESGSWSRISLADVAASINVTPAALIHRVGSKIGLFMAYLKQVDAETLANADPETDGASVRERLFDLMLCRFDAMEPRKKAIAAILPTALDDPIHALSGAALLGRSLVKILEAAGVSTSGINGFARVNGLGLIYLRCVQIWLKDESTDLSKTMAELDKRLGQADSLVHWLQSRRTGRKSPN